MKAIQFIENLRPAIPMSAERPCTIMSKGEIKRHMLNGALLINGERVSADEEIDSPINSIVFFPKSWSRKTTIV
jgi:hypothetical protein